MSLTKKTPKQFVEQTFEWGIYVNDVQVSHQGQDRAPDTFKTEWPNQMTATTHSSSFHAADEAAPSKVTRLKRSMTFSNLRAQASPKKHSISLSLRCAFFRYPIITRLKGASKVCCLELEIILPGKPTFWLVLQLPPTDPLPFIGYNNTPEAMAGYLHTFNVLINDMDHLQTARIVVRLHKDQALVRDPNMTHEQYLTRSLLSLGHRTPTLRALTIIMILTRNAEHRKLQVTGTRPAAGAPFDMTWTDSAAQEEHSTTASCHPVDHSPAPFSHRPAAPFGPSGYPRAAHAGPTSRINSALVPTPHRLPSARRPQFVALRANTSPLLPGPHQHYKRASRVLRGVYYHSGGYQGGPYLQS